MSGIKADHKPIEEWIRLVDDGAILLPNFQRDEVWTHHKVETLFDSILKGRPIGCLLVLEVDDPVNLLFSPHKIGGGEPDPAEACEYQLLDGQQRIVALWRALTDRHKERIFFVKTGLDDDEDSWVKSHKRPAEGKTATSWMGKPKECLKRGLIPLRLLRNRETTAADEKWIDEAAKQTAEGDVDGDSPDAISSGARGLERKIRKQSEVIRNFQIPFLALPAGTTREVAIDVFIRTNTSSTQLTKFDITVGEVQSKAQQDLRTALDLIEEQVPELEQYLPKKSEVGDLVMKIACLWNGKTPNEKNYTHPSVMSTAVDSLDKIGDGIKWALKVLDQECVWDEQRLPSKVPLRVLPALHPCLPPSKADQAKALKIVRRYLWWAFLSDRYESTVATLLLDDYRGLVTALGDSRKASDIPIFNEEEVDFPLSQEGDIRIGSAPWPKSLKRLSRALLAIMLRKGARDIASNDRANRSNVKTRQYHHLFPPGFLKQSRHHAGAALAMNCVLISAKTSRTRADNPPIDYLKDRIGKEIKDADMEERLGSHLVPYGDLVIGRGNVAKAYDRFIESRSLLFHDPLEKLKKGVDWPSSKHR